jgi:hypothetical protein
VVVVVVVVVGELGAGAVAAEVLVVGVGKGLTGGLEAGAIVVGGLEAAGATDVAGETGACAAAKLNAASDSATEQSGRSTRFM